MPCHIIITTVLDLWDASWLSLEVGPLSREQSLDLITDIAGSSVANGYGLRLTEIADGLPAQLVPASASLAYQARRGSTDVTSFILLDRESSSSFRRMSAARPSAKLLIHAAARLNPQRIPRDELQHHLVKALGWSEEEFQRNLDHCLDLFVLQGASELRMHKLFAQFVQEAQTLDVWPHHLQMSCGCRSPG